MRERFGKKLKPLGEIADVICGPFGSAIKNTDYQEAGVPLVRITNISKEGYMNYDDMIYISEELGNRFKKTQVSQGDIVISQRGSLGQCAIVDDVFGKMNISANIIAIKNIRESSASFIRDYLLSTLGQTLLERNVSGQVQQKITTQDIADILVPIGCNETYLSKMITTAREFYKYKIKQSGDLLSGMSKYMHSVLGIREVSVQKPVVFAVNSHMTFGARIDPEYHNPYYTHRVEEIEKLTYDTLGNIIEFSTEAWDQKAIFEKSFPYIEISGVQIRENSYKTTDVAVSVAPSRAKMIVRNGDIIVSTTRPHRGAIATIFCDEADVQIASTGFCVLRKLKRRDVLKEYLQWILLDDYVLLQMLQRSSGGNYPAITSDELKKVVIPIPDICVQQVICAEGAKRKKLADRFRTEAQQEWQEAKAQFERELLGE